MISVQCKLSIKYNNKIYNIVKVNNPVFVNPVLCYFFIILCYPQCDTSRICDVTYNTSQMIQVNIDMTKKFPIKGRCPL